MAVKRKKSARKKATKKKAAPKKKKARRRKAATQSIVPLSVDVRMYNVGLGDCFLLTFKSKKGSTVSENRHPDRFWLNWEKQTQWSKSVASRRTDRQRLWWQEFRTRCRSCDASAQRPHVGVWRQVGRHANDAVASQNDCPTMDGGSRRGQSSENQRASQSTCCPSSPAIAW